MNAYGCMAGTGPGRGKPREETLLLHAKGFLCLQLVLDEAEGAILRSSWCESRTATDVARAIRPDREGGSL